MYDPAPSPEDRPEWYYLSDVTADKNGNLYAACAGDDEEDFIVWSMSKDLKLRWIRRGLKYSHEDTGITVTSDGNLYLWDKRKHSLLKLSSKDGTSIRKIPGRKPSGDDRYGFSIQNCTSLVSDPDGTILALVNDTIVRYTSEGRRASLWGTAAAVREEKRGFLSKLFGFAGGAGKQVPENESDRAPYIKDIGNRPERIKSEYTRLNMGWDGYLYMIDRSTSEGNAAKYNREGKQLWSVQIPLYYKECKPCTDQKGNVYILGTNEKSHTNLIQISDEGKQIKTLLTDIKEGGVLDEEDQLAVSPDGMIYILKYYSKLKIFTPDLKMIYRSKQSEKEDEEVLKEKKESIENDEELT